MPSSPGAVRVKHLLEPSATPTPKSPTCTSVSWHPPRDPRCRPQHSGRWASHRKQCQRLPRNLRLCIRRLTERAGHRVLRVPRARCSPSPRGPPPCVLGPAFPVASRKLTVGREALGRRARTRCPSTSPGSGTPARALRNRKYCGISRSITMYYEVFRCISLYYAARRSTITFTFTKKVQLLLHVLVQLLVFSLTTLSLGLSLVTTLTIDVFFPRSRA